MLFFDARRRETLSELSTLMSAFSSAVDASCVYVVVCAKCEPRERVVSEDDGCAFAKSINAMYTEFSAATMSQHDTMRLFDTVLEAVVVHIDESKRRAALAVPADNNGSSDVNSGSTRRHATVNALSCFAMTLRSMFVCTACVAPAAQQQQQRTRAAAATAGIKQYIARECPCFECNKVPARAPSALRAAH
jgi:hypothetical protein